MLKLFLLFTLVPAIELYLLLQIGAWLGPTYTFVLIVVTGAIGAWLAKREGVGVLQTLSVELRNGIPPGARLMEGALVVMGGILLITPGVFTDLTGFLLIAPPTRRWLAPRAVAWLMTKFELRGGFGAGQSTDPNGGPTPFSNPFDDLP